jgi:hypothetical protein
MSDIDAKTGLPELPEGEIWRLIEQRSWHGSSFAEVQIFKIVKQERRRYWEFGFFKIPHGDPYYIENVTVLYRMPLWDASKPIDRDDRFAIEAPDGKSYLAMHTDSVTEELVKEAAEWCMVRRAVIEKADSLFGNYPPNRLGSTDA